MGIGYIYRSMRVGIMICMPRNPTTLNKYYSDTGTRLLDNGNGNVGNRKSGKELDFLY